MAGGRHESNDTTDSSTSEAAGDDFEFRVLSTGGLVPAGAGAGAGAAVADMCVADELFSDGKLLPFRSSSAAAADAPSGLVLLPRSESVAGFGSRSDSRSASSSGSSSGCVSRSHSSKSASSDHAAAPPPPRMSLSSSLFYVHPSPSPQLRSRPRRSTGSAPPPAAWGILRLGVVGAPDVYPPRPAEAKITASARGGSGRSARFEHPSNAMERKHGVGMLGDGLGCKCSPDVVEPGRAPEAAKKSRASGGVKRAQSFRRSSRILDWLEELSIIREKK